MPKKMKISESLNVQVDSAENIDEVILKPREKKQAPVKKKTPNSVSNDLFSQSVQLNAETASEFLIEEEHHKPFLPLRIVMVTSEAHPYAKSGGLADVCASLPAALAERGHAVSVIMPYYPQVMGDLCAQTHVEIQTLRVPFGCWEEWAMVRRIEVNQNLNFYFIEFNRYFDRPKLYDYDNIEYSDNGDRYIFFCRAAMEAMIALELRPDIIHAHDWHAALVNTYMTSPLYRHHPMLAHARTVLTIHNLGYQGNFDKGCLWLTGLGWEYFNQGCFEFYDRINLLKGGIMTSDMVSTVSPTYAEEILSPEHGFMLDSALRHCASRGRLRGILNGIDVIEWNSASDPCLPAHFDVGDMTGKAVCKAALQKAFHLIIDPEKPLIAVVSRLATQKGLDVFLSVIDGILASNRAQIVILGSGDPALSAYVNHYAAVYPGRFGAWIGYNHALSHLIEAGADFFAMPSRYEPCGLNQMYSMHYGTLPVVRSTGGLEDTVVNYAPDNLERATGFKFYDLTGDALWGTLNWMLSIYEKYPEHIQRMQKNGMETDFSWNATAKHYEDLYHDALRVEKGL